jgi:hypothetical protein
MIDLGADYLIAVDVSDADGDLTNAASVVLTVTLPDGTTETPAVSNPPDVTGQYRYTYQPAVSGRFSWQLVTVSPDTAYGDVEYVKEADPPSFISLRDAKNQLGIDADDTSEDDDLRAWLAGVTWALEERLKRKIARRTVTDQVTASCGRFRLWSTPVISLAELTSADGLTTYDVDDFFVTNLSGLVRQISGGNVTGDLVAAYVVGDPQPGYNIYQAGLLLLQHVWDSRRGPGQIPGGVIGPEETMDFRHYTSMPRKVTEWLPGPDVPVA